MTTVNVASVVGSFAENKEKARQLRIKRVLPELKRGGEVTLDFRDVTLATQSFIHALIGGPIRELGPEVLERLLFSGCNENVRGIIEVVVSYTQDEA